MGDTVKGPIFEAKSGPYHISPPSLISYSPASGTVRNSFLVFYKWSSLRCFALADWAYQENGFCVFFLANPLLFFSLSLPIILSGEHTARHRTREGPTLLTLPTCSCHAKLFLKLSTGIAQTIKGRQCPSSSGLCCGAGWCLSSLERSLCLVKQILRTLTGSCYLTKPTVNPRLSRKLEYGGQRVKNTHSQDPGKKRILTSLVLSLLEKGWPSSPFHRRESGCCSPDVVVIVIGNHVHFFPIVAWVFCCQPVWREQRIGANRRLTGRRGEDLGQSKLELDGFCQAQMIGVFFRFSSPFP